VWLKKPLVSDRHIGKRTSDVSKSTVWLPGICMLARSFDLPFRSSEVLMLSFGCIPHTTPHQSSSPVHRITSLSAPVMIQSPNARHAIHINTTETSRHPAILHAFQRPLHLASRFRWQGNRGQGLNDQLRGSCRNTAPCRSHH